MARSLWTGSLSFGLVNVPVALFSAARDLDIHFNQLHEEDGARIETRRFCADEDREVPYEEIGHGYELDSGEQVVLSDDELASVAPEKTRTIDIQAFVDAADVDPVFYDHPYFLVPTGESQGPLRAYRLLVEVMGSTDRVALGRFVLRTKEYLVAVRVRDGLLSLTTMLFADEVRPAKGIPAGGKKPTKAALEQAEKLIDALTVAWDPSQYEDRHRERLRAIVEKKQQGKTIKAPAQEKEPAPTGDLMEALKRTLAELGGGGNGGGEQRAGRFTKDDLEGLSRDELYERAQEADLPGRSSMSKKELVKALAAP